jgi:hypothetical protein
MQAHQTSQYVVPCGGIFLGKWRSSFAGSSDGKMNAQSAYALNTLYISSYVTIYLNKETINLSDNSCFCLYGVKAHIFPTTFSDIVSYSFRNT